MSADRYSAPTEQDEDAYEDAWYRALKAKASRRFADPKDDKTDAPTTPTPSTPSTPSTPPPRNERDAGSDTS